jgi:C_GCAxxG_C_C family probable redox protein
MKDYTEIMEDSKKIHAQKFNCAQSVLCALSDYTGMEDLTAKAVAAGFGGGVRAGEICGAVAGGVMALGLATATDGIGSSDAPIGDRTRRFIAEFKERFNTVRCDELLEAAGGHERCDAFISYSAQLAAAIIDEVNESKDNIN